jgi:hypothetical protein
MPVLPAGPLPVRLSPRRPAHSQPLVTAAMRREVGQAGRLGRRERTRPRGTKISTPGRSSQAWAGNYADFGKKALSLFAHFEPSVPGG